MSIYMSDHILLLPPSPVPPPKRFQRVRSGVVLASYQLYAVERWITSRDRTPLLVVHTGIPEHSVVLEAYAPVDLAAWNSAIAALRANGSRPKQTPQGTVMLTSLAHFRSDYTIVPIPGGEYLAVQHQLYANINLLRMGCSARSALTLEDPGETTKDRFISSYLLPESTIVPYPGSSEHLPLPPLSHTSSYHSPNRHSRQTRNMSTSSLPSRKDLLVGKTKDRPTFVATVLEFVKLIQAALAIFGIYPVECASVSPNLLIDGLLCDTTLAGIKLWTTRIGAPCVGLQSTERVIDPSFVAALLSLVLATRNRLAYLGYAFILPRDPFLCPHAFALALTTFLQATAPAPVPTSHNSNSVFSTPHGSVHVSTPLIPHAPPPTNLLSAAAASAAAATLPIGAILTRETVENITSQYEHRTRTESRKVRRVLKGKRAAAATADSDGGEGATPEREHNRKHALNLSLSLSGGEETPGANAAGGAAKNQLLSGIASGLRGGSAALATVGVNVGGGMNSDAVLGDPGAVNAPTRDLATFVILVAGTARPGTRTGGRAKRLSRDGTLEHVIGSGAPAEDAGVAASVRALWGGRVGELVRMREDAAVHDATTATASGMRERRGTTTGLGSDGEESNARSNDGRSTEEESEVSTGTGAFGGMWSGRVRGKLGTWAGGLSRKKHYSVDLGSSSASGAPRGKDVGAVPLALAMSDASSHQSQPQLQLQEPSRGRPQPGRLTISRSASPSALSRRPSAASRAQSPTLPPMVFSMDADREMDDDDLLSSGQVSPLSDDRPTPFSMAGDPAASLTASSARLAALSARGIVHARPPHHRAVQSARVASWAGSRSRALAPEDGDGTLRSPVSDEDGESDVPTRPRREKARFHSLLSVVDPTGVRGEAVLASEESDEGEDEAVRDEGYISDDEGAAARRRRGGFDPRRRRSFHDLDTFRDTEVLNPERMALDVELCGELLTAWRREEHLRNVMACVRLFSASLAQTNTGLRAHHDAHTEAMREIEQRAQVLATLDTAHATADKLAQATHTLRYESEQFRADDLWAAARTPRRTVLALRARVLGASGRRLAPGVHGAHGPYNRLQRGLDGSTRLVDHLGRSESEAEEEEALAALGAYLDGPAGALEAAGGMGPPGEEEGAVVAHPSIKPMWLLRFFTSWGARWSAAASAPSAPAPASEKVSPVIPQSAPTVASTGTLVEVEKIPRPASH